MIPCPGRIVKRGTHLRRAAGTEVGQVVSELSDTKLPGKSYQAAYDEVAREYAKRGVDLSKLPVKTEPNAIGKEPKEPTEPITDLSPLPAKLAETVDHEIESRMNSTWSIRDVLLAMWIAGAAVAGLVLLASNLRFADKLKKTRKRLTGQTGILPMYVSRSAETPCLLGVFRPKIYLMGEATANETISYPISVYKSRNHFLIGPCFGSVTALLATRCVLCYNIRKPAAHSAAEKPFGF